MKPSPDTIRNRIADDYPDAMFLDGHDDAILGTITSASGLGGADALVAYDSKKVVDTHQRVHGMNDEEAHDFFEFNIANTYCGVYTPVFMTGVSAWI